MCLTEILFSKLRVYCSKEMDMPFFFICYTLFGTEVRLPTYQHNLPLWDPTHSSVPIVISLGIVA